MAHRLALAPRLACAALAALLLGAGGTGVAAELTLGEAVRRTLETSPALRAGTADIDAAQARIAQADMAPATDVVLELENFAGSGELRGTDELETTLAFERAIERGGKRTLRVDAARAGHEAAELDLDVARLEVAADAAGRFIRVLGAQAEERVVGRFLGLAEGIRDEAARRVEAGRALSAELYRARAAVGRDRLAVATAGAQADIAWRELAAAWGEPGAPALAAVGDLFAAPEPEPLAVLEERLAVTPRAARRAAERRVRLAEARLADADARADVGLSLGVRHLAGPDDFGLVAGVSLPIGTGARARPRVAEAQALVARSEAEEARDAAEARAALARVHRQAVLHREALRVLDAEVLPATSAALEQVERGYRLGRLSYAEYAQAAREALDAEVERVRVATELHQALIEMDALTGMSLSATENGS